MTPCPFCKSTDIAPADTIGFPVSAYCENCHAVGPAKLTAKEADEAWEQCKITGETSDGYHTFNELYSAACLCDCPACRIRKRTSNS